MTIGESSISSTPWGDGNRRGADEPPARVLRSRVCAVDDRESPRNHGATLAPALGQQTVKSQELKYRERLAVEALYADAPALRPDALVKRHHRADAGAVDQTEG